MRVAVFTTNDPRNYSGGRYHGLMLAYAAAAADIETVMITDHIPAFDSDVAPLSPRRKVRFHQTPDFRSQLPDGKFDFVVVVPTGIFLPEFYENALAFAANADAAIALVNFESGNWFNSIAPEPKDIRLWSYWQRVLVAGGLCLSSARESAKWAREFYRANDAQAVRHEVWSPPINSRAARAFDSIKKDGSILAFVRPTDRHKGSQDLFHLQPGLFKGRTINFVAGRDVDEAFQGDVRRHFASASEVRFHVRVSDSRKFELMAPAAAVLFPSRFEGYGYPPVEAAYCGTESVCFDLPVLEETVGRVAHIAPKGDFAEFNEGLKAALARSERRIELRSAVEQIADFDKASEMLIEILTRSMTVVPRRRALPYRVLIGPFAKAPVHKPEDCDRADFGPPVPAIVVGAKHTAAGDLMVSIDAQFRVNVSAFEAGVENGLPTYCIPCRGKEAYGWVRWKIHILTPREAIGKIIRIRPKTPTQGIDEILIKAEQAHEQKKDLKTVFGVSEIKTDPDATRLRGWIIAERPVEFIHVSTDGRTWAKAAVTTERRDVAEKHPGYPTRVCGFIAELPAGTDPKQGMIVALENAGVLFDVISGWIPSEKRLFELPKMPAEPAISVVKSTDVPQEAITEVVTKHSVVLTIADTTDAYWSRGVLRKGSADRLGTIRVVATPESAALQARTIIQFASGSLRRITRLEKKGNFIEICLDGPINPIRDGAQPAKTLPDELVTGPASFLLSEWTDKNWLRGVWNISGPNHRRSFFVRTDLASSPRLRQGMLLSFATSGVRKVMEVRAEGKNARVFLDAEIRPFGDGAPNRVTVLAPMTALEETSILSLDKVGGTKANPPKGKQTSVLNVENDAVSARISPGSILRLASGLMRRVVSLEPESRHTVVRLDRSIDRDLTIAPSVVSIADPRRVVDGQWQDYVYDVPTFAAPKALFQLLVSEARRRGRGFVSERQKSTESVPRILVLSLVPHQPANQGNRVVTRNLIQHLLELGFKVDLVVQNWVDPWSTFKGLEANLKIVVLPFPDWQKVPGVEARRKIQAILQENDMSGVDRPVVDALSQSANHFHPFFIAGNEMVETAAGLLARHSYSALVVNYTHLIRVLKELESRHRLPPSVVLTHDALSRLPTEFEGQKIDTAYRACAPDVEAAALNAVDGMTIVAISRSEAEYFKKIGVTNPICVAEYDAFEEAQQYRVQIDSFVSKTVIFHGSANPMNIAGLNWFVDRCWDQIRERVPDVRLVVCGRICEAWASNQPGIELVGEVDRDVMFRRLSKSTLAINPCVAGTGLKIKTVEAASLGLPSVCLPNAVDGLEDVASQFSIVVTSPQAFASACVDLLKNQVIWKALRKSALQVSEARFSRAAVYRSMDAAMGWKKRAERGEDKSEPTNAETLVANWMAAHGTLSAARLAADQRIAEAADDVHLYLLAAELALRDKDGWQATIYAASAAALAPAEADAYRFMGEGLLDAGHRHSAIEALFQARMLRPNDRRILRLLEECCLANGDAEGAKRAKSLREASESAPEIVGS